MRSSDRSSVSVATFNTLKVRSDLVHRNRREMCSSREHISCGVGSCSKTNLSPASADAAVPVVLPRRLAACAGAAVPVVAEQASKAHSLLRPLRQILRSCNTAIRARKYQSGSVLSERKPTNDRGL